MIVRNEEPVLARCLASVKPAVDEIIVVDTGSDDATPAIAESFGARLFRQPWSDDFSAPRNRSIAEATGAWVLWLDADDVVPADSVPRLVELKKRRPDRMLSFTVKNEKPGNTGSEFLQVRMFPNRPDLRFERRIHEQVMPAALRLGLRMETVPVVIEHHGYADAETVRKKARRNVDLLLIEHEAAPADPVLCLEIADSWSILDDRRQSEAWYEKTLAVPGCETHFKAIAAQALLGLGNSSNLDGNYHNAVTLFNRALALTPDRADIMFSLAVAHDLAKELEQAAVILERIFQVPDRPYPVAVDYRMARIKAFLRLERVLRDLKQADRAVEAANRFGVTMQGRPEVLNCAGMIHVRAGRLIDGLHLFEKSLAVTIQGNVDAYIGLCCIYLKAGNRQPAQQSVKTMAQLFPNHPRFLAFRTIFDEATVPEGGLNGVAKETIEAEMAAIREGFGI